MVKTLRSMPANNKARQRSRVDDTDLFAQRIDDRQFHFKLAFAKFVGAAVPQRLAKRAMCSRPVCQALSPASIVMPWSR